MELLENQPGKKIFLLGNEAVVRGLIEAGVGFVATYPGTPSSEVGGTLEKAAKPAGIYFEYAPNEKVAMEEVAASSASGVRSFTAMKHVGLNVASDAFMTVGYTGVRAGLVIMTADDPSAHSSQNEQDNRYYARLAGVPMLEPATPQEGKEMIKYAFELSEKIGAMVMFRTTTRMNHVRGVITLGDIPAERKTKGHFDKAPSRFVTIPSNARREHPELLERLEKAEEMAETSPFNYILKGDGKVGIITSGVAYNYVMEMRNVLGIEPDVLKLGLTFPLPRKMLSDFIKSHDTLMIAEELEPILEKEVTVLAKDVKPSVRIVGKLSGDLPLTYEYNSEVVGSVMAKLYDVAIPYETEELREIELPVRPPTLCPGCPHRATYHALGKAMKVLKIKPEDVVFSSDIGCYTLGIQEPFEMADFLLCMGSSVGAAGGFAQSSDQIPISFIGDSTFFHSGIPGLVNNLYNKHRFVYVILDNSITAMTGHQPNPGMGITGMHEVGQKIDIEALVKGLGVEFVKVVDPYDIQATMKLFKEALQYDGPAVIIARHPCALLEYRDKKRKGPVPVYTVNEEKCTNCHICVDTFACPAFVALPNIMSIDPAVCLGCGSCVPVCPFNAFEVLKEGEQ